MSSGWIKLHRSLLDWEWWDDQNTTRLFIYLLISASHSRKKWKSIDIEPGDIKTDQPTLSKKTGISIRGIRTSLTKLKSTGEVSVKTTNKYSVISINNWNQFQQDDSQVVTQATDKRQTNDRLTSYLKNDKNEKNNNIALRENFFLSLEDKSSDYVISIANKFEIKPHEVMGLSIECAEHCRKKNIFKESKDEWDRYFFSWVNRAVNQYKKFRPLSEREADKNKPKLSEEDKWIIENVKII